MFQTNSEIHFSDTDATGGVFFPKLLEKCLITLEKFLKSQNQPLQAFLEKEFLFPVVHVEMDFYAPLKFSEELTIELLLQRLGTTSVAFLYRFLNKERIPLAEVEITHVLTDKKTALKTDLTLEIRQLFEKLCKEPLLAVPALS